MDYIQQKTPFIEKWEKTMEDMLKGDTEFKYQSGFPDGADSSTLEQSLKSNIELQKVAQAFKPNLLNVNSKEKEGQKKPGKDKRGNSLLDKAKELEVAPEALSESDEEEGPRSKKRKAEPEDLNRKEQHNATEKKRRERINCKLEELKGMIPHCKNTATQKAAVLSQAVDYIKTLVNSYNEQIELNKRLQEHGFVLHNELTDLHQGVWARDRTLYETITNNGHFASMGPSSHKS
eukprot:TRINITY_DN4906_c0_g9_i1.p1 TRINITY_DN4906_c0_g9~~TRINITY_DN4906_c0_g9_i1.p1  ORF type:complete len:234 (+),score=52.21 TRINITY_DN4906_c0_g9_i1:111-812(+)